MADEREEDNRIFHFAPRFAPAFLGLPPVFGQWEREAREWRRAEFMALRNQRERIRDEEIIRMEGQLAALQRVNDELPWPDRPDLIVERAEEGGGVTEEMVREAQILREKDASDPSSTRFSRACLICATENPRQRAVFTRCGHIVCFSCAVDNAKSDATNGKCVFCRSKSGFVKLFEEEFGNENDKKDVNVENGTQTDENLKN